MNEKADELANQGAAAAPRCKDLGVDKLSCSEAKTRLKSNAVKKWKNRWFRQNTGTTMVAEINPKRRLKQIHSREVEVKVHRMILQRTKLEEHMHQMYPEANPTPSCECHSDTGTVEHFLQSCPTHNIARSVMLDTIESGFRKLDINPAHFSTNSKTLLGLNENLPPEMQTIIASSLSKVVVPSS